MRQFTISNATVGIAATFDPATMMTSNPTGAGERSPADGSTCPRCPPEIPRPTWVDVWRRFGIAGCMRLCNLPGGTPGLGYGGMSGPMDPPPIQRDPNGCAVGWNQPKQPLGAQALAVAAGATAPPITVTPRQSFQPFQLIFTGTPDAFEILSMNVNGVEYVGSGVPISADAYGPQVTDHSVSLGMVTSTTPLIMLVRNYSLAAGDFRATFMGAASRS